MHASKCHKHQVQSYSGGLQSCRAARSTTDDTILASAGKAIRVNDSNAKQHDTASEQQQTVPAISLCLSNACPRRLQKMHLGWRESALRHLRLLLRCASCSQLALRLLLPCEMSRVYSTKVFRSQLWAFAPRRQDLQAYASTPVDMFVPGWHAADFCTVCTLV